MDYDDGGYDNRGRGGYGRGGWGRGRGRGYRGRGRGSYGGQPYYPQDAGGFSEDGPIPPPGRGMFGL